MIFKKKIVEEIKATYIVANFPINQKGGDSMEGLPKLDHVNGILELMINIDNGMIVGWPKSDREWVVSSFVQKNGKYTLMDSNYKPISVINEGEYGVPNNILPPEDGLCEYILLKINKDGFITNWLKAPSLIDFEENENNK